MLNEKKKFRVVCLGADIESPDPWRDSGQSAPPEMQLELLPLLQANTWQDSSPFNPVQIVLVDIDAVARTEPLDHWALQAWRSTFNDFIARAISQGGKAPLLLAYTREPNWERALVGIQVGARDLVKLSKLNEHLKEIFGGLSFEDSPADNKEIIAAENLKARAENVISFGKNARRFDAPTALDADEKVEKKSIPKHVIPFPIEGLDGQSLAIEGVRELIRRTAPLDTPVHIVGQTGSGKELVARTMHRYSSRRLGPFVTLNCGAISPHLIESELFGHVKGAFTDATQDSEGVLRSAHGGTLFLDEIAQLTPDLQVKLLRVIQDRKVTPVGSTQVQDIDVRIISATQEDLSDWVAQGKFREDLLFRIRVIELALPSLSERKSDIPDICKVVLKKLSRKHRKHLLDVADSAMEKFLLHTWPGNIRELENVLEHAATLAWAENRFSIETNDLPESVRFVLMQTGSQHQLKDAVRRFEREFISATIRRLGGSKEAAAQSLGLSLATLYRKMGS